MSFSSFSLDDFDNVSNFRVDQAAHGFSVGEVLKTTGTNTYALAQADSDDNAEVAGIVSKVIDANSFKLRIVGRQNGLSGLVPDTVYFLSHVTAGALTTTDPATVGSGFVSKPVLLTDSTTSGMILTYRGINDGGGSGSGGFDLNDLNDVNAPTPNDNDILTWDSGTSKWIPEAAAGGGGVGTVISSGTASNVSSIDFTGLTSGYQSYRLVLDEINEQTAATTIILLRTSTNNGVSYDSGSADYNLAGYGRNSSGTERSVSDGGAGLSNIQLTLDAQGDAATDSGALVVDIINPSNSATQTKIYWKYVYDLASGLEWTQGAGRRASAASVDAFRVYPLGGNISAKYVLYGITDS